MATLMPVRFTSIEFRNYKALRHFSLSLQDVNILVGPNNCGKSTIIGAFRVLSAGLRIARARNPERVASEGDVIKAYRIPEEQLGISTENVHTDYSDEDSTVTFRLNNGNKLRLLFDQSGGCLLTFETQVPRVIGSSKGFKNEFPVTVSVVPVLGPLEHDEEIVTLPTIQRNLNTHRASRHFRNYWYFYPQRFSEFADLVCQTWPGMQIEKPESVDNKLLRMFCRENRMTRELYWSGFGFQVWVQLLTHVNRAREDSILVIDEPEIYLHPDIQRQLLGILRRLGPHVLVATHSAEMMSEAEPSEIVLIDKARRSGERLRDIAGIQVVLDQVGSVQNITLARLARSRRVVYVEGDHDFSYIVHFARVAGLFELADGTELTPIPTGGFSNWQRIRNVAWGINRALGTPLRILVVLDRDYRCDEETTEVETELLRHVESVHIHGMKEIENYLLDVTVIHRAITRQLYEEEKGTPPSLDEVSSIMQDIAESMRTGAQSQYIAKRVAYFRGSHKDDASVTAEAMRIFEEHWKSPEQRLALISGKEALKQVRQEVQARYGVTLSDRRIISLFWKKGLHPDILRLLKLLEDFRASGPLKGE